jgi:hypothetical protein
VAATHASSRSTDACPGTRSTRARSPKPTYSSSTTSSKDNLDSKFFAPQFDLASDAEQRYLLGLASLGDGPYRSSAAATAAGYADTPGASHIRDSLIEKELLWSPRRGFVDFTVPYFADYLQDIRGET